MFRYFVDGNEFTKKNYFEIPINKVSSPNENTPAFEYDDLTYWCKKGNIWHRLTGPAYISSDGREDFYLNGKKYENVTDWLKEHPNQDETFQKEMLEKYNK
jgi:hypothetical protein